MKYFGEFLISKNIIKKDQLVSLLIEQIRTIPSYLEIVWDENLFSPEQILKIIEIQQTDGMDFKSTCQKLGLWNNDLHAKLEEIINRKRKPLGQLLLEHSVLDQGRLTTLLDDFFSQMGSPKEGIARISEQDHPRIEQKKPTEFLLFLNPERIENFRSLSSLLEGQEDLDMLKPMLKEIIIELHSMKGVASLDGLGKTVEQLNKIEASTVKTIAGLKKGSLNELHKLTSTLEKFSSILPIIHQSLTQGQGDDSLWDSPDLKRLNEELNG